MADFRDESVAKNNNPSVSSVSDVVANEEWEHEFSTIIFVPPAFECALKEVIETALKRSLQMCPIIVQKTWSLVEKHEYVGKLTMPMNMISILPSSPAPSTLKTNNVISSVTALRYVISDTSPLPIKSFGESNYEYLHRLPADIWRGQLKSNLFKWESAEAILFDRNENGQQQEEGEEKTNTTTMMFVNFEYKHGREQTYNRDYFLEQIIGRTCSIRSQFVERYATQRRSFYLIPQFVTPVKHIRIAVDRHCKWNGSARAKTSSNEFTNISIEMEYNDAVHHGENEQFFEFENQFQQIVDFLLKNVVCKAFVYDDGGANGSLSSSAAPPQVDHHILYKLALAQNEILISTPESIPSLLTAYIHKHVFSNSFGEFIEAANAIQKLHRSSAEVASATGPSSVGYSLQIKFDGIPCYALVVGEDIFFKSKMGNIWREGTVPIVSATPMIVIAEVFTDFSNSLVKLKPGRDFVVHTIVAVLVPSWYKNVFKNTITKVYSRENDSSNCRSTTSETYVVDDQREVSTNNNTTDSSGLLSFLYSYASTTIKEKEEEDDRRDGKEIKKEESICIDENENDKEECQEEEQEEEEKNINNNNDESIYDDETYDHVKSHECAMFYGKGLYNSFLPNINGKIKPFSDAKIFIRIPTWKSLEFMNLFAQYDDNRCAHWFVAPYCIDQRKIVADFLPPFDEKQQQIDKSYSLVDIGLGLFFCKSKLIDRVALEKRDTIFFDKNGDDDDEKDCNGLSRADGLFVSLWLKPNLTNKIASQQCAAAGGLKRDVDGIVRGGGGGETMSVVKLSQHLEDEYGSFNLKLKTNDTIELSTFFERVKISDDTDSERLRSAKPVAVLTDNRLNVSSLCRFPKSVFQTAWYKTPWAIQVVDASAGHVNLSATPIYNPKTATAAAAVASVVIPTSLIKMILEFRVDVKAAAAAATTEVEPTFVFKQVRMDKPRSDMNLKIAGLCAQTLFVEKLTNADCWKCWLDNEALLWVEKELKPFVELFVSKSNLISIFNKIIVRYCQLFTVSVHEIHEKI